MTDKEMLEYAAKAAGLRLGGPPLEPGLERFFHAAFAAGEAAEREACAKELELIAQQIPADYREGFVYKAVMQCVATIRERCKKDE